MNIIEMTATELGKKIRAGEVSAVEATKEVLEQIQAVEGQIHAFVTVDEEGALKDVYKRQAGGCR